MNREAFRQGFIESCAHRGIQHEDTVLDLYKEALCGCGGGEGEPYYDVDAAADKNERMFEGDKQFRGPNMAGGPMMDPADLVTSPAPMEPDPDDMPLEEPAMADQGAGDESDLLAAMTGGADEGMPEEEPTDEEVPPPEEGAESAPELSTLLGKKAAAFWATQLFNR